MDSQHNTVRGNDAESRKMLWDLIGEIRFAMLTTRHTNGHLHSRPVTTQNSTLDDDGNLWFFMSRSGEPVADLLREPLVNAAYSHPGKDTYVSVSGAATISENMAKKQELWSTQAEAWFPKGVNDPDLALVQLSIAHANYWDVKDSKIVQLYKMAKASVTGSPPTDMGEQGEIRMR